MLAQVVKETVLSTKIVPKAGILFCNVLDSEYSKVIFRLPEIKENCSHDFMKNVCYSFKKLSYNSKLTYLYKELLFQLN